MGMGVVLFLPKNSASNNLSDELFLLLGNNQITSAQNHGHKRTFSLELFVRLVSNLLGEISFQLSRFLKIFNFELRTEYLHLVAKKTELSE
jgi:hypothetical protein